MTTSERSTPFSSLGLSAQLVRATSELGYEGATPVQAAVIPAVLRGGDVWASAETGSGKTASFVLPILHRLAGPRRRLAALILVPTRELAAQVAESVRAYGRHLEPPPKTCAVFGGVSINPQMMALRGGADVVVATPGRLLDLHRKNAISLGAVSTLVLDEADRLLERGFADELAGILELVPTRRQTLLFSATFPAAVQALAARVLREPTRIEIASAPTTAPAILQRVIEVDRPKRGPLLRHLLEEHAPGRVLVFVATTYATEHVTGKLRQGGIPAAPLHGKLSQGARTRALADFRDGNLRVLVATDVAARGLDIVELPWVVNYDLPRSPTDYLHRIGRTGRAGARGVAVSFVSADTHAHFRLIERRHGLALPRERIAGFEPLGAWCQTSPDGFPSATGPDRRSARRGNAEHFRGGTGGEAGSSRRKDEERSFDTRLPKSPPAREAGTGGVKGKRKSKKDKLREAAARAGGSGPARG